MSKFKTADANSVYHKTETEHRIGVSRGSGTIRPNKLLLETIQSNGSQIKVHMLTEDLDKDYKKGDLFLEIVAHDGLNPRKYGSKELQYQCRAATELFVESINKDFKSLNCKVAMEPIEMEGMNLYPIITASAIIKE